MHGAKIKLVDIGDPDPTESIQLLESQGTQQATKNASQQSVKKPNNRYGMSSPPQNIAPATAEMDKLMAELMAGKTTSPKQSAVRNHQKPATDKVNAVQSSAEQGVKANTMKPDFNKNTVLRSMSLLTDNTAFNIEPPS